MKRRQWILSATAIVAACSEDESPQGGSGAGGEAPQGGSPDQGGAGGTPPLGGSGGEGGEGGSTPVDPNGWASGGTGSMSGDYPDPFTDDLGDVCELTCATTLGPCYAQTIERKDISEGYPGLPVRLALLLVDEACLPVAGATIDIWHTSTLGLYSGDDATNMCTSGDPDAQSHRFFRGIQTTDENGRVDFDTCLAGWYPGRAIHIHVRVRVADQDYLVSQLFFPQSVIDEVFPVHPDYAELGLPDTPNATDSIYSPANEIQYDKMRDGAMLAWKVMVLRSSLADPVCFDGNV